MYAIKNLYTSNYIQHNKMESRSFNNLMLFHTKTTAKKYIEKELNQSEKYDAVKIK